MQDFAMSAFETLDGVEEFAGSVIPEKGVRKQFNDFMLNQLETDKFACTLYSTWNVLGNLTGLALSKEARKAVFDKMVADGKMRPGFGASLDDGMRYALNAFNAEFKTAFVPHKILLSSASIMAALEHSGIATGIRFNSAYLADEQNDGRIEKPVEAISGTSGHSISVVKMNTTDQSIGAQLKIQENYPGRLPYNIIYFRDFDSYANMFFRTGWWFSK